MPRRPSGASALTCGPATAGKTAACASATWAFSQRIGDKFLHPQCGAAVKNSLPKMKGRMKTAIKGQLGACPRAPRGIQFATARLKRPFQWWEVRSEQPQSKPLRDKEVQTFKS